MYSNSNMEQKYEAFLNANDRVLKIGGTKYHKIIHKERVAFQDGIVIITVPHALFSGTGNNTIVDENGHSFHLGPACRMNFRGEIPQWYLNAIAVQVDGIHDISEIGNYLTLKRRSLPMLVC